MRHGVLVIDKPRGITSHDVVDRVRRLLTTRKVGHLGTLDPAATGVLPVAVGRATRLGRYFETSPKEYTGEICLGRETTTGDAEGDAVDERPVRVRPDEIRTSMQALTGPIEQVPPAYSAKKIGGVAAYKLARAGRKVDLRPVPVVVESFELLSFDSPCLRFRVVCSAGTYVRSLARDLGHALGTGGHLTALRRLRAGIFTLTEARSIESASWEDIIPSVDLLAGLPSITVDEPEAERVRNGNRVACIADHPTLCILNKNGDLIAIAIAEKGWAHPKVMVL